MIVDGVGGVYGGVLVCGGLVFGGGDYCYVEVVGG